MYFLYSVLSAAAMVLAAPYFLWMGLSQKKYLHNLRERFALRFPDSLQTNHAAADAIWVHAVSVGEVLAAVPLARALKQRFPDRRLLISTTTATGQALAQERMTFADAVFYFPLDWRGPVRRALAAARPALVVIFETEIWPNFLREARRAGVPVVFVNGRISDRSFRGYNRALRFAGGVLRGFLRRMLNDATLYLMQSPEDAARLMALGAPAERVAVTGNLKYDLAPPSANALTAWLGAEMARSGRGPLLVAGSVIAGEENAVLEAYSAVAQKWPGALLVLAPRKPERFDAAAQIIAQAGMRVIRRSEIVLDSNADNILAGATQDQAPVLLLDSIGELAALYTLADAVFIGGSLVPVGGHNPLEPAACGAVPLFGPSMDNFREIAARFLQADAAVQVRSGEELGATWIALLRDADRRTRMGRAAREIVEQSRGATAATLDRIAALMTSPGEQTGSVPAEARLGNGAGRG